MKKQLDLNTLKTVSGGTVGVGVGVGVAVGVSGGKSSKHGKGCGC